MSRAIEDLRQAALKYENDLSGAVGETLVPATNKIMVSVDTIFAAVEEYDIQSKVIFAMTKLAKDMREEIDGQQ
mgnify:CR=1 FL=1